MTKAEQVEYVKTEADNAGVPFNMAWSLFEILGESEMYDGFIIELEDAAYYCEE